VVIKYDYRRLQLNIWKQIPKYTLTFPSNSDSLPSPSTSAICPRRRIFCSPCLADQSLHYLLAMCIFIKTQKRSSSSNSKESTSDRIREKKKEKRKRKRWSCPYFLFGYLVGQVNNLLLTMLLTHAHL
jgi:hypothetical protein